MQTKKNENELSYQKNENELYYKIVVLNTPLFIIAIPSMVFGVAPSDFIIKTILYINILFITINYNIHFIIKILIIFASTYIFLYLQKSSKKPTPTSESTIPSNDKTDSINEIDYSRDASV